MTIYSSIISSNSAIDLYTIKAYSLEHNKQCYNNIVIGKKKYIACCDKSAGTFYFIVQHTKAPIFQIKGKAHT